jgi:hypothetical protein
MPEPGAQRRTTAKLFVFRSNRRKRFAVPGFVRDPDSIFLVRGETEDWISTLEHIVSLMREIQVHSCQPHSDQEKIDHFLGESS